MNFGGVVFASPLSTTVLLLQPASTCTILPSSGKIICHDKAFSIILGMVVFGYNIAREMIWILVKYNLLKYR